MNKGNAQDSRDSGIRWLLEYLHDKKCSVFIGLSSMLLVTSLTLLIGQGIEHAFSIDEGDLTKARIDNLLILFFLVSLTLFLGIFFRNYILGTLGEQIVTSIRKELFAKLISLNQHQIDMNVSGEIEHRFSADTLLLQTVLTTALPIAVGALMMIVGSIMMMLITSHVLSIVLISSILLSYPLFFLLGKKVAYWSKRSQERLAASSAFAGDSISHLRLIQAFVVELKMEKKFRTFADLILDSARKRIFFSSVLISVANLSIMIIIGGIFYYGSIETIDGELSLGEFFAFLFYAFIFAVSMIDLSSAFTEIQRVNGAAERLCEILNIKSHPAKKHSKGDTLLSSSPMSFDANDSSENVKEAIRFDRVSFSYPLSEGSQVLSEISFSIKEKEKVALVGKSGAGKSTILDLLLRFYEPDSGKILLDGSPISRLNLATLRRSFAIVPQYNAVLDMTIYENLLLGSPSASHEQVIKAAMSAQAHEFIQQLPSGYKTKMTEYGKRLSPGQIQRICIARALLANPKILLLDEATCGLDSVSEQKVRIALRELMKNRTTITIDHNLKTVTTSDKLVIIDDGRVEAIGTHDQLLDQSPIYQNLTSVQLNTNR